MSEAGAAGGAPRTPQSLPRARRLRRHNDFLRVERSGVRAQGKLVSLLARPGRGRVGFTVSKKVSLKATARNLVKRRLREIVRRDPAWWQGLDLVVMARAESVGATLAALSEDVARAAAQLAAALAAARASAAGAGRARAREGRDGSSKKQR